MTGHRSARTHGPIRRRFARSPHPGRPLNVILGTNLPMTPSSGSTGGRIVRLQPAHHQIDVGGVGCRSRSHPLQRQTSAVRAGQPLLIIGAALLRVGYG